MQVPPVTTAAAIYARVSTKEQSCDMQLSELREFSTRMGWTVLEYVDTGFSGTKRNRPEFLRLMADAKLRKFDVVLVRKMDRFGRSLQHLIESIFTLGEFRDPFPRAAAGHRHRPEISGRPSADAAARGLFMSSSGTSSSIASRPAWRRRSAKANTAGARRGSSVEITHLHCTRRG